MHQMGRFELFKSEENVQRNLKHGTQMWCNTINDDISSEYGWLPTGYMVRLLSGAAQPTVSMLPTIIWLMRQ